MAFTSTDLTNVETAITELATGSREVQVSVGDKMIRYAETDLSKLMTLRTIIKADIAAGDAGGGFFNKVRFDSPT